MARHVGSRYLAEVAAQLRLHLFEAVSDRVPQWMLTALQCWSDPSMLEHALQKAGLDVASAIRTLYPEPGGPLSGADCELVSPAFNAEICVGQLIALLQNDAFVFGRIVSRQQPTADRPFEDTFSVRVAPDSVQEGAVQEGVSRVLIHTFQASVDMSGWTMVTVDDAGAHSRDTCVDDDSENNATEKEDTLELFRMLTGSYRSCTVSCWCPAELHLCSAPVVGSGAAVPGCAAPPATELTCAWCGRLCAGLQPLVMPLYVVGIRRVYLTSHPDKNNSPWAPKLFRLARRHHNTKKASGSFAWFEAMKRDFETIPDVDESYQPHPEADWDDDIPQCYRRSQHQSQQCNSDQEPAAQRSPSSHPDPGLAARFMSTSASNGNAAALLCDSHPALSMFHAHQCVELALKAVVLRERGASFAELAHENPHSLEHWQHQAASASVKAVDIGCISRAYLETRYVVISPWLHAGAQIGHFEC